MNGISHTLLKVSVNFCSILSRNNYGKHIMNEISQFAPVWKRPSEVPYPNVWRRFQTKPKDGKTLSVKIVDLTPDRYEETMEFMMKYYLTEEPLSVSSKLLEDEVSIRIYRHALSKVLEIGISILAVLDEDVPQPEIIGVQLLSVFSKDDPPLPEVPGEAINKRKRIHRDIEINANPFEVLGVDAFINDWGLCVKPKYRGLNIGYNTLLSLKNLAQAYNIKGTMNKSTSVQSQKLVEKLGFKTYNEIVYSDYKDENGQVVFPVEGTKSVKLMGNKYA